VALLILCFTINIQAQEETINIVCTNTVLADFTSNIIKENVTINYIMPGGACPAHFDTSPEDIQKIVNADVIISLGWEPWLTDLLEKSGNTDYIEIKCSKLGEWSYPENAKKYIEKIRDDLSDAYPELNQTIQQNAEEYLALIDETANDLQNMMTRMEYKDRQVISISWHIEYLEWLGVDIVASYDSPEGMSTQDKINISEAATENDVSVIIDNLQSGTDFGEQIASESDVTHVVFTNFPGAIDDVGTYLEALNYNTVQLINGITIYDYKQTGVGALESKFSNIELQRNAAIIIAIIAFLLVLVLFVMYKKK
jgi:ABC-type Zn uptake system ZnuABC Zn-binding protein ZnuA